MSRDNLLAATRLIDRYHPSLPPSRDAVRDRTRSADNTSDGSLMSYSIDRSGVRDRISIRFHPLHQITDQCFRATASSNVCNDTKIKVFLHDDRALSKVRSLDSFSLKTYTCLVSFGYYVFTLRHTIRFDDQKRAISR